MKKIWLDYFLVFWLIMISGSPVLVPNNRREVAALLATFFICFLSSNFLKRVAANTNVRIFSVPLLFIFIFQAFEFDLFPLQSIASFYIRMLLGVVLFCAIPSGPEKYVKCLYWICNLSLIFYATSEFLRVGLGVDSRTIFEPLRFISGNPDILHAIFYNFDGEGEPNRNSGPFWEPGAFAGYILIAILLLPQYKNLSSKSMYFKQLIALIIALLSTQSTTGYLLLPIALIPHVQLNFNKNLRLLGFRMLAAASMVAAAIIFAPSLFQLDFLREKISKQYEETVNERQGWELTRFGNFLFDLQYIEKRPFFGWGVNEKTRYALNGGKAVAGQGNGLTDGIIKFGFVGFGLYAISLFLSFRRYFNGNKKYIYPSLLVVMLALNGEIFLNFPIFLGLIALPRSPQAARDYSRWKFSYLQTELQ